MTARQKCVCPASCPHTRIRPRARVSPPSRPRLQLRARRPPSLKRPYRHIHIIMYIPPRTPPRSCPPARTARIACTARGPGEGQSSVASFRHSNGLGWTCGQSLAPFPVGPRDLVPLSIQLGISVPRVAPPMRRLDVERRYTKRASTPHSPPQKSGHTNSNGVKIRPLDKDYYLNQQIPPGILLGLSSSSKGIKDSNGHIRPYNELCQKNEKRTQRVLN